MNEPRGIIYRMGPAGNLLFVRWSGTTTVNTFDHERFWDYTHHRPEEGEIFNLLHLDRTVQEGGYHDLLFHDPDRIVAIFIPEGADRTAVQAGLVKRFGAGTELREELAHCMLTTEKILALEAVADHPSPA